MSEGNAREAKECSCAFSSEGEKVSQVKERKTGEKKKKNHETLHLNVKMELPAAGEHVFAVESIEKKRSRKVCHMKMKRSS